MIPKEFYKRYTLGVPENKETLMLCKDLYMQTQDITQNKNIMVIGGANSGKTHCFIEPNIMQANGSYIIADSLGMLYKRYGAYLESRGYKVKILDIRHPEQSDHYNPFRYIKSEADTERLVETIFKNTGQESRNADPFWEKAEKALLTAIISYVHSYMPQSEQTFSSVMQLLKMADTDENETSNHDTLDKLFEEAEEKDGENHAVTLYKAFKMGPGKTQKSVIISSIMRLQMFLTEDTAAVTGTDDMALDMIGNEKIALFIVKAKGDSSPKVISAMLYSQFFDYMFKNGYGHPVYINLLIDDLSEAGIIPNLGLTMLASRKFGISIVMTLNSLDAVKTRYKKDWELIMTGCDKIINLGGAIDFTTMTWFRQVLDKTVVDMFELNYGKLEKNRLKSTNRELENEDECLVVIQEADICIKGKKCRAEDHPAWPMVQAAQTEKIKTAKGINFEIYEESGNPFDLVRDTWDVLCLVDAITDGQPKKPETMEKAEKMLLAAVMEYQRMFFPDHMKNLDQTLRIIRRNTDDIFHRLSPELMTRKFYNTFEETAGDAKQEVITDASIKLAEFRPEKTDLRRYWDKTSTEMQEEKILRTTVDGKEIKARNAAIQEIDNAIENLKRLKAALLVKKDC